MSAHERVRQVRRLVQQRHARAIDFCGQEHEYFTRRKVEDAASISTRRRLGDPASLTMLDVGCGVGETDELLVAARRRAPRRRHRGGGDRAAAAAQTRRSRTRLTTAKRCHTKTPTSTLRSRSACMHHVDVQHRPQFASELRRVVRPGGLAVVFEHNPYNPLTQRVVRELRVRRRRRSAEPAHGAALALGCGTSADRGPLRHLLAVRQTLVSAAMERSIGWLPAGAQHYVAAQR